MVCFVSGRMGDRYGFKVRGEKMRFYLKNDTITLTL